MVIIKLDSSKEEKVKDIFRRWFYKQGNLSEFYKVIKNDNLLKKIIFLENKNYKYIEYIANIKIEGNSAKIQKCKDILEAFFFNKFYFDELSHYYKSQYVGVNGKINAQSQEYFLRKYNNFRNSQGAKFVKALNVNICPYCNRSYLELYTCKDNGKLKKYFKGELDHYYSKSKYPYLALCIFNLIPSCKVCNHEKLDEDIRVIYPYRNEKEECCRFKISELTDKDIFDITFRNKIADLDKKKYDITYLQGTSDNFKVEIEATNDKYKKVVDNSIKCFNLDKKYNSSKNYIKCILRRNYIYNESYVNSLYNSFGEYFESKDEVKKVLFDSEFKDSEFDNRPLSKLTFDIIQSIKK